MNDNIMNLYYMMGHYWNIGDYRRENQEQTSLTDLHK